MIEEQTESTKYTEKEVLAILIEQHRLFAVHNMGDPELKLEGTTHIDDWRSSMDLLHWEPLSEYLNIAWRIEVPKSEWSKVFTKEKTLASLCKIISYYAVKSTYEPIKLFGKECASAAIFLRIKQNLSDRGLDVNGLKPSSKIYDYAIDNPSPILEEISQTGKQVFSELKVGKIRKEKKTLLEKLNILDKYSYYLYDEHIVTFRDLVNMIMDDKPLPSETE